MTHRTWLIALLVAGTAASLWFIIPSDADAVSDGKDPCCFTNPRFTGVCKVTPGEDESCANILAYLNSQTSVGKSYCGNTTVRGGWQSVTCESDSSTETESIAFELASTGQTR